MKRINLKPNVVQSIFDIIGNNPIQGGVDDDDVRYADEVELTSGSVQECAITNLKRICAAIAGFEEGRVMKGMEIIKSGTLRSHISITPGIAFTKAGNVIVFNSALMIDTANWPNASFIKIYAKHRMSSVKKNNGGVNTTFLKGATRSENISFDEAASCVPDLNAVNDYTYYVDVYADSDNKPECDYVYIGMFDIYSGSIYIGTNRGFGPNDNSVITDGGTQIINNMQLSKGLHSMEMSKFDGTLFLNCNIIIIQYNGDQKTAQDATVEYQKPDDGGTGTMVFSRGLLVEVL
jgi:hypothetical protein